MKRSFPTLGTTMLALVIGGCGGSPAAEEPTFPKPEPVAAPAPTTEPTSDIPAPGEPVFKPAAAGLNADQKKQMEIALKRGGDKAAQCHSVVPDAAKGEGEVLVLFDGKVGRVTEAKVGAPWAGTPVESCIKRAFVGEYGLPFEGDPIEVPYQIRLGEKPPEKKATDSKKPATDAKKPATK